MDGTVGPAQNLAGPDFGIGAELGTIRGTNLFHSFQTFNIHTGESATFTGPDSIDNVISRVTGGEISTINGLLRSEVGHADFYFINPSGVVFGPNAQVDVPGAFHISTATELRFGDDTAYSATDIGASTLSLAQPESFGFLSPQPASITVNGSQLEFVPESRESLSAGNVTIQDGASLVSAGGDVRITAVGESGGVVPLAAEPVNSAGSGTVAITGASTINVSGTEGSASVALCGGQVEVADSVVAADHSGSEDAGGQILLEADSVRVINSDIRARVLGAGKGNDILVVAEDLEVDATTATNGRSRLTTRVMPGASGVAGDVRVEAADVTLTNGGQLSSIIEDGANGQGGAVEVRTDSLQIDNGGVFGRSTGIKTEAGFLATGSAGPIVVEVADALELVDGGVITSGTSGAGGAGDILVRAGSLHMDGGDEPFTLIASNADLFSSGDAGSVLLEIDGPMSLHNGARVSSDAYSFSSGDAGRVEVQADELLIDGNAQTGITSEAHAFSIGRAGSIIVTVNDLLELRNQGKISSLSFGGDAGMVKVRAGRLSMVGSNDPAQYPTFISSDAGDKSFGVAGIVDVWVDGRMALADGAHISASNGGFSTSSAGSVTIHADELTMDGGNSFAWVTCLTVFSEGDAGLVDITVEGAMEMHNAAEITATSLTAGQGGNVAVQAGSLRLDGGGSEAGISSGAKGAGVGGLVQVTVDDLLELVRGGFISSGTFAEGDGGGIEINAGELYMANQGSEQFTGLTSAANLKSTGDAGDIHVGVSGPLDIIDGAQILSSTFAAGNAGSIDVETSSLYIDGSGITERFTGIASSSEPNALGDGGPTTVVVQGRAELHSGGGISSTTSSPGDAGDIVVRANELLIDGKSGTRLSAISSGANADAIGKVGVVDIQAPRLLLANGGEITIAAAQTLPDIPLMTDSVGRIVVHTDDLQLHSGARITAESTGNVPAGALEIHAGDLLMESESRITTESNEADGGPIGIGGQNIVMRDSLITTSVEGLSGDGGNISVNADALVLQGGFIQANTAAPMARGGDIFIDTNALVASYGLLEVGGTERLTFQPGSGRNVIQAAAPGGAYGTITITSPGLDISGALVPLSTHFADVPRLIGDPCVAAAGQTNSSLIQRGRGGLPAGPEQPSAPFFGGERLDRLLEPEAGPSVNDSQAGEGTNSPTGGQRGR